MRCAALRWRSRPRARRAARSRSDTRAAHREGAASAATPSGPCATTAVPESAEDLLDRRSDDASVLQRKHTVRMLDLLDILRRKAHRAALGSQRIDDFPDEAPLDRVERCGRLVEQEHARLAEH